MKLYNLIYFHLNYVSQNEITCKFGLFEAGESGSFIWEFDAVLACKEGSLVLVKPLSAET